jgi:hypothetical protein
LINVCIGGEMKKDVLYKEIPIPKCAAATGTMLLVMHDFYFRDHCYGGDGEF